MGTIESRNKVFVQSKKAFSGYHLRVLLTPGLRRLVAAYNAEEVDRPWSFPPAVLSSISSSTKNS